MKRKVKLRLIKGGNPQTRKEKKPHSKKCQCGTCVAAFMSSYKQRVREMVIPKIKSAKETVPVRAHFRKQPNHLKRQPRKRNQVHVFLEAFIKGMTERTG